MAFLGEDEAERLRLAHDAIVSGAVEEHDGVVVKHLRDGAMATFGGAAGAVGAAVAIQQQLDRFNRESRSEPVRVRIGISVGDVTVEDGDYFGLPVVQAQRLEASAEPATIRCAELVKHLTSGRGDHEFRDLGPLDLKGLADPLPACEVGWVPLDAQSRHHQPELPPVLSLAGGMPFSGRAEAMDELVDLAKQCATDGFATALVAGEPGIGKTRLAHELARRVIADGGQVLAGRCDEDVAVPHQPIRAALDWYVSRQGDDALEGLGSYPGDLVRLLPDLADRVGSLPPPLDADPEAEKYRLLQAVESWLRSAASRTPVLLVLDDIHWADKATLVLLQHLIRAAPSGLLIVCTYRDTDVDRSHPLSAVLADLRRLPDVQRIALTGLPAEEVREFLERAGGHALDETGEAFAEMVVRETAGNPFFVSELLRHFAESGLMTHTDGRWTGDLGEGASHIPEGIREVVGRRLGRLGDDVEEVLRAASVIGYEFDIELLANVVGRPVDEVLDQIDIAAGASLAVEVGIDRFRFSHALVRETLHDELSSTRRARQHRKVAMALEAVHGDDVTLVLADLATHWREATVGGDPTRAIELAIAAGEQAVAASAPDPGVTWFESALEMMEDGDAGELLGQVLVKLAAAQIRAGDPIHRATTMQAVTAALEAGNVDIAVAGLTLRSRSSFSEFDEADPQKIDLLRKALDVLELDDVQRADLTAELATELIFTRDIAGRRAALADFGAMIEPLPDQERRRLITSGWGRITNIPTRALVTTMAEATDVMAAERTISVHLPGYAVGAALYGGDRQQIDRAVERWRPIVDQEPLSRANSIVWQVPLLVLDGDLTGAEALAKELLALMRQLQMPESGVYFSTTTMGIQRELGGLDRYVDGWDGAARASHPSSATAAGGAFLHLSAGNCDRAAAMLEAYDADDVADDAGYAMSIALMSEVAAVLGTADQCAPLVARCEESSPLHAFTGGLYLGTFDRLLALLHDRMGDHDAADTCFAMALDQLRELRSPTWLARTHLDIAESRLARSQVEEARSALDAARDVLDGCDLPASRARHDELLAPPRDGGASG